MIYIETGLVRNVSKSYGYISHNIYTLYYYVRFCSLENELFIDVS